MSTRAPLRTPDHRQAEVLALPMIAEHKAKLLAARPRLEPTWQYQYEPGREHVGPDGGRKRYKVRSGRTKQDVIEALKKKATNSTPG